MSKERKKDETEVQTKVTCKVWKEQLERRPRRSDLEGEFVELREESV